MLVSYDIVGGKSKAVTGFERDGAMLKATDTVFRTLGVKHYGDRDAKLGTRLLYGVHHTLVVGVFTV